MRKIKTMRTILKQCLLLVFFLTFITISHAQDESKAASKGFDFGIELQAYPTGIIPGFRIERYINTKSSMNLRLGYQLIDHRDLGVQDNEEGSGFGASFAYRRFFKPDHKGLSLAIRTDVWFNIIDWETGMQTGSTDITVLQPTLMGEYAFRTDSNFVITPSLSFGFEWNVATEGEPTGEGAILLIGCTFGFGI